MKDLKTSLKKVASDLMKAAKDVEKLAGKLEAQTKAKAKPKKRAAVKKPLKQTVSAKQPTAVDTAFNVIKRHRKGVKDRI